MLSTAAGQSQVKSLKLRSLGPQDSKNDFLTRYPLLHTVVITSRDLTSQQVQQISCLPHLHKIEFRETGIANWIRSPQASALFGAYEIHKNCALAFLTQVSCLHFCENKSTTRDLAGLACLHNLQHLCLDLQPHQVPFVALCLLSSLTSLKIAALHPHLAKLKQLKCLFLKLSDAVVSTKGLSVATGILGVHNPLPFKFLQLSCLFSLTISSQGCYIGHSYLQSFSLLQALRHLSISRALPRDAWPGLGELVQIRSLELYQQPQRLQVFHFLSEMCQLTSLHPYARPGDHASAASLVPMVALLLSVRTKTPDPPEAEVALQFWRWTRVYLSISSAQQPLQNRCLFRGVPSVQNAVF